MKCFAFVRRFHRLTAPSALLIALLQRTPVVEVATDAESALIASRIGDVLRAVGATVASLGAIQSMAGGTPLVTNPTADAAGFTTTVGTSVSVVFGVTGTQTPPASWKVQGSVPPGLNFSGLTGPGVVNVTNLALTGTPTTAGTYALKLNAYEGPNATLNVSPTYSYNITIQGSSSTPAFTLQPTSQTVTAGSSVTFTTTVTGAMSYQWQFNGANIVGATSSSLTLNNVTSANVGSYTLIATNQAGSTTSNPAYFTVSTNSSSGPTAWLSNLSVRANMVAGQTMIVGFTMSGGAENVLVRADGPGLVKTFPQFFTSSDVMADPRLAYYPNGASSSTATNDNWDPSLASAFASVGAFPLDSGSTDAAFIQPINGVNNTVWVQGTGGGTVLVEAYALGSTNTPRLINLSARNQVGTGANILIAGFVLQGTGTKTLLVRGIGPALKDLFNVGDALTDPIVEIHDSADNVVASNNDWSSSLASTFTTVGAYQFSAGSKDAALVVTLPASPSGTAYTAQVKGNNGLTGEAVVEVYEVP